MRTIQVQKVDNQSRPDSIHPITTQMQSQFELDQKKTNCGMLIINYKLLKKLGLGK